MPEPRKPLVLAAMIFAVAMMFIDQTIVALAVPELQKDIGLSSTGTQWIVNGYVLALAALFAFGGKLADVAGRRRMVVVGVIGFATCSALCGATPTSGIGEAWMITFRVLQGASAAVMFPAALAIVVETYPLRERGKALATFFGITGGLTAVGPLLGGFLTEWTWRAIFWINIPVAIIALVLTARAHPAEGKHPGRLDYRGAVLISGAMGLAVLGFQQAGAWGWGDPATIGCIAAGAALLLVFVLVERRTAEPLIDLGIFRSRAFAVDNLVLFLLSVTFVSIFFFASLYAQLALGWSSSEAGLYLLSFFGGFAAAAQVGGRVLDARGARVPVVVGCVVAAAGYALWAVQLPELSFGSQWYAIVIAGAGSGLVLGPVSTDAVNRAPHASYGEVTGITQTVRNFGGSLGLAVLGSMLIAQNTSRIESTLSSAGVPTSQADQIARAIGASGGGDASSFSAEAGPRAPEIFAAVQKDFAESTRVVFLVMAGVMALAFVVALVGVPRGRVEDPAEAADPEPEPEPRAAAAA